MRFFEAYHSKKIGFVLLALALTALIGCGQAQTESTTEPAEALEPLVEVANVSEPTPLPTPTPTPFAAPAPTPTPRTVSAEMVLARVNSAMAQIESFQAEGSVILPPEPDATGRSLPTQFWAEVDLRGDSRMMMSQDPNGRLFSGKDSKEIRYVDGTGYAKEHRSGVWTPEVAQDSFLDNQFTVQAALSGTLVLEDMELEEVVGSDWKTVYRITGFTSNGSASSQVVLLVGTEDLLIREMQLNPQQSPDLAGDTGTGYDNLEIRFSQFNEPVEIPAPQLEPAPASITTDLSYAEVDNELLLASFDRWNELSSFRADMDMVMELQGEIITAQINMAQSENGRVSMVMDMDMGSGFGMPAGGPVTMEMIIDTTDIYMKMDGQTWYRMGGDIWGDMGQSTFPFAGGTTDSYVNPFSIDDMPWDAFTVRSLGRETIDGVETEHLAIDLDLQEFWDQLDQDWQDQFAGSMMISPEESEFMMDFLSEGLQIRNYEVWIDDEGYIRKGLLAMAMEFPGFGESMSMDLSMEMKLYDYGEDITIALPAQYEDFFNMFGNSPY